MEALLLSLLVWIGTHSTLNVEGVELPKVIEMTPTEITREMYRHSGLTAKTPEVNERVIALYDPTAADTGTIYVLAAQLAPRAGKYADKLANPYFQERLLHELVHHVQYRTGEIERLPCRAAAEGEAYRLAGRFIRERGLPDPLPNRRFWTYFYSRC
ncbi:MAG: hypothetical protein R3E83_00370 [Burkholderiaceae bacterium]